MADPLRPHRPTVRRRRPARAAIAVVLALAPLAACSGGGSGGSATGTSAPALVGVRGSGSFTGSGLVQSANTVAAERCGAPGARVLRQDKGSVTEGVLAGASLSWSACFAEDGSLVGQVGPLEVTAPSGGLTGDVTTATVTSSPECAAEQRASVQGCVQQLELAFDVTEGTGGWATDTPTTVTMTYTGTTTTGFGGLLQGEQLSGTVTIG